MMTLWQLIYCFAYIMYAIFATLIAWLIIMFPFLIVGLVVWGLFHMKRKDKR